MKTVIIEGKKREKFGKVSSHAQRREGLVPGVLYGGKEEIHFLVSKKELSPLIYTAEFVKVDLKIDGTSYVCIVKDIQFDKVTDQLIHVDLLELVPNKKVKAEVPLKLVGNAEGVKQGGKLLFKLKTVKVLTIPEKLKEIIEVDITHLNIGENVRVKDIQAEGIRILNSPKVPVAGVVITRALKQEAAAAAKEGGKK